MPIPKLDKYGFLPEGRHPCTLTEVEKYFCSSERRIALLKGLKGFIAEMRGKFRQPLYIDGSYVTDKVEPSDIDVVLDMRLAPETEQFEAFKYMQIHRPRLLAEFRVDFWVNLAASNQPDFCDFFEYVGVKSASQKGLQPKHLKGILQVV